MKTDISAYKAPSTNIGITKTCLYNFDPFKPHFYIIKLGFTGVYIIFLILLKNIDCGYLLELPHQAVLTSTHNLCFEQKYEKYQNFLSKCFPFLAVKFSIYLNRRVFVMNSIHFYTVQTYFSQIVKLLSLIFKLLWENFHNTLRKAIHSISGLCQMELWLKTILEQVSNLFPHLLAYYYLENVKLLVHA